MDILYTKWKLETDANKTKIVDKPELFALNDTTIFPLRHS